MHYSFWKNQGVNGPKPWFFFGNSIQTLTLNPLDYDAENKKKFGKIYGTFDLMKPSLVVTDKLILKKILIDNHSSFKDRNGNSSVFSSAKNDDWKSSRRLMSHSFSPLNLKAMGPKIDAAIKTLLSNLDFLTNERVSSEIDSLSVFGSFSLDVIARCCFNLDIKQEGSYAEEFLMHANDFFKVSRPKLFLSHILPNSVKKLFKFSVNSKESIQYLRNLCSKLVEKYGTSEHHEVGVSGKYFLQLMMECKDSSGLTKDQIIDNCILFFAVGFEATSLVLSYSSYVLALYPDVQDAIYLEIQSLKSMEYEGTYSDQLPVMDNFLKEVLRLYTPALRTQRVATQNFNFTYGGKKIFVPNGTVVRIPIHVIHSDADYYHNPDEFNLKRFASVNAPHLKDCTFLPFGAGPRNCVGSTFALTEIKKALVAIVQKYKFLKSENTADKLDVSHSSILLHAKCVKVTVEKRRCE